MRAPKTHSPILWHFPGGPKWDESTQQQGKERKTDAEAYDILLKIIKSRHLKLGPYKEKISNRFPKLALRKNPLGIIETGYEEQFLAMETKPVVCVADIPISELGFHSQRYGRVALGFRREDLMTFGFNPVLYVPETSNLASDLVRMHISCYHLTAHADVISQADLGRKQVLLGSFCEDLFDNLMDIISYAKPIPPDQFEEIFSEREWRTAIQYNFVPESLAMLLLPQDVKEDFVRRDSKILGFPDSVEVKSWEEEVDAKQ